jgi:archaellum component FlaG (FlaF/FlaG flagellin family)
MRALVLASTLLASLSLGATASARAQGLTVSPSPLDFGTVAVGTTATKPLSVANTNTDPMATVMVASISKPATTACDAFSVTPSPALPDTIPAGATRTWTVAFKPAMSSSYDCSIMVNDNDGNDDVIHVVGTGGVATLGAVPSPVAFGPVVVGTMTDQTVTLRNTGTVPLVLGAIAPPAAPFSLINAPASGTTIPPAGSVMFAVRFAPTAVGSASGTVTIPSNDPMSPFALQLTGSGATSGGPAIALAPSTVMFGSTPVGAPANATFTVGNTGTQTLAVTSMTITGANAADFTFADGALGCTGGQGCASDFTVAPSGTPRTVTLACKPQAFGTRLATLAVASNASSGTSSVALNCTGTAPSVKTTPTSIAFGVVRVNTQASAQLAIANAGNVDLHVASINVTGTNAADFAESGCALGCTIKPGGTVNATVTFTPPARGARSASVVIQSDDPASPSYVVPLTGAGGAGVLAITQPAGGAIDFGNIPVGVTSSAAPITIQNQGELGLTIDTITTSPSQFVRSGPAAPTTLAPGASATWQITCTPPATSTYSGATTFTSDALTDSTRTVTLACTGAVGSLVANPAPVSFGAVRTDRTKTMTVMVKNVGGVALTVQSATLEDASGVFKVTSQAVLPHQLAPGASIGFDVTFAPKGAQTYMGKLVLTDANAQTALTVNLSGDGQVASFAVTPTSYDFGTLCVGQSASTDVMIANNGSATLRLTQTRVGGGPFSLSTGDVGNGVDLPAGQTRTLTVVGVAPAGAAQGALAIATDLASGGTSSVALMIAGAGDKVAASPESIDFGEQPLLVAGAPQQVTVVNCSKTALTISSVAITGDTAAFAQQGPPTITIPVGGSQAWSVVFTAQHDGGTTGSLVFTTDQGALTVALSGTGGASAGGDGGTGSGDQGNTYYGCGCRANGAQLPGGAAPIVVAFALILRRRRRGRVRGLHNL